MNFYIYTKHENQVLYTFLIYRDQDFLKKNITELLSTNMGQLRNMVTEINSTFSGISPKKGLRVDTVTSKVFIFKQTRK